MTEWAYRRKLLAAYQLAETASITVAVEALAKTGDLRARDRLPLLMDDLLDAGSQWRFALGPAQAAGLDLLIDSAREFCAEHATDLDLIVTGRNFVAMEDLHFVEPPLRGAHDWQEIADTLRANPGRWARLGDRPVPMSVVNAIRQDSIAALRRSDGFQVRSRNIHPDGSPPVRVGDLYLRYQPKKED